MWCDVFVVYTIGVPAKMLQLMPKDDPKLTGDHALPCGPASFMTSHIHVLRQVTNAHHSFIKGARLPVAHFHSTLTMADTWRDGLWLKVLIPSFSSLSGICTHNGTLRRL